MELIGKGPGVSGAVWVARRIPDGYISGHANHARITTFPLSDGRKSISSKEFDKLFNPEVETVYAYDVIDVAREFGWFKGKDKNFSFSDTYAPLDFGAARFCEARVWAGFNKVNDKMGKYESYAMGEDLSERMPLWIKPDEKLGVGAGPYGATMRARPLTWEVDGESYFNERAISTQQTGFSFVAQCRSWLPDPVGGILWFGVDDTYYTAYSPMYCGINEIPDAFAVGNGDMMTFDNDAAFWVFNQVSNFAYSKASLVEGDIKTIQKKLERGYIEEVAEIDMIASKIYQEDPELATRYLSDYSVNAGNRTTDIWKKFYGFLFAKYLDGNMKEKREIPEGYKYITPKIEYVGYPEEWYRKIVKETGDKFKNK